MKTTIKTIVGILAITILSFGIYSFTNTKADEVKPKTKLKTYATLHKTVKVNGLNIFYREAGDVNKPTILLLHGYPTSSHMYRNLITDLSVQYHVIAPDYPAMSGRPNPQKDWHLHA